MNVDKLLRRYFAENEQQPMIEVFDHDTIYDTYRNIVQLLNSYPDIGKRNGYGYI
jgi:hypothetical protein